MFATCYLNHIHLIIFFMVKSPNCKAPYTTASSLLDVITVLNILSWNTFNPLALEMDI